MIRKLIRRWAPYWLRLRVALLRRQLRDRRGGVRFAHTMGPGAPFPHVLSEYSRPFVDYAGQESLGQAKRQNQRVMARALDGIVVQPGETLSIWALAGRPSAAKGYAPAAALKAGELISEIGGAICLLSTVVFNAALLSGLEITERWCHSVDSYGDRRYFQLGRDAAIEFGYRDLRFLNPHACALQLLVIVDESSVLARIASQEPLQVDVTLDVAVSRTGPRLRAVTTRFVSVSGGPAVAVPPFTSDYWSPIGDDSRGR